MQNSKKYLLPTEQRNLRANKFLEFFSLLICQFTVQIETYIIFYLVFGREKRQKDILA